MSSEIFDTLADMIHEGSPYTGFDAGSIEPKLKGWAYDNPIFDLLVTELRPALIIEVGTWLGASAVNMANIAKANGIETTILCVDTWLGSAIHRMDPRFRADLGLKHGFPTMYYQFLANVVHCGHDDVIMPFPMASSAAFSWLKEREVSADLIYIDGDHELGAVYADISNYWSLLGPKGVIFGDDFLPNFPGVIAAVNNFSDKINVRPQIVAEKWVLGFWKDIPRFGRADGHV